MINRKFLIDSAVVQLVYDLINAPEKTMAERIDKLTMLEEFRKKLDEAEVSPWEDCIYPWEDGSGLPAADRLAGKCVCKGGVTYADSLIYPDEAVEEAGKEIRHD